MTENKVIMELKSRIELIDKNYKEEAADYRDVLKIAVTSLEEIQQYRTLGTVEEIEEILQIISERQDDVDESGISTGLLHTLLEYAKYAKIGTVQECLEAVERQKKKPPAIDAFNRKTCPFCGYIIGYEGDYGIEYEPHCSNCGQAVDWGFLKEKANECESGTIDGRT